jgi:hypothetical protein
MRKILDHLKNDWYKYTLETAVVILGVLIAFSLSSWNEKRKARALEQSYYCKILEDINQDADQIREQIEENKSRILNSNKLVQLLQADNLYRVELVNIQRLSIARTARKFVPSTAAFDDLKSSGSLNILKDQEIKDQLIDYYSTIESIVDIINVNSQSALDIYYNPKQDFLDLGWYYIDYVREVVDTTMMDLEALDQIASLSDETKKNMISDAIFFLKSNARKGILFSELEEEILRVQKYMKTKCPTQK